MALKVLSDDVGRRIEVIQAIRCNLAWGWWLPFLVLGVAPLRADVTKPDVAAEISEHETEASADHDGEHGSAGTSDAGHGADAAHGAAEHSGEHHDPYDLSAANAGPTQESMFDFKSDLALATLIVFVLLLAILTKFAWGPITEALDRREKAIADQIAETERSRNEASRLLAEHEKRLAAAAEEVRGMLDQARRAGEDLKKKIVAEAEQAAANQKDRALREIEVAKNGALEELTRKSVEQAVSIASTILRREVRPEDQSRFIQEGLARLPSKN